MAPQNSTLNCSVDERTRALTISILYFLIFPPALVLNILVAWISLHLKAKTTFMVYLKHLVAADLLMSLTFPFRAASELPTAPQWLMVITCRFWHVLFYLALNMSIILMGFISLDRFFKIVQPGGKVLCRNLAVGQVLATGSWLLVLSTNTLPIIFTSNMDPKNSSHHEICMKMKSELGVMWHKGVILLAEVIFWVVCVVVVLSYICITKKVVESYRRSHSSNEQKNRKAKLRVFLILFVFFICYVPYHVVRIPYTKHQIIKEDSCIRPMLKVAKDVAQWLSAANVCLDPLIYFFLCKAFRKKFLEMWELNKIFKSFGKNAEACPSSDTSL